MNIFDKIYLYSPDDREFKAEVVEIMYRARKGGKTYHRVEVRHIGKAYNGDRQMVIEDGMCHYTGWNWSTQPIPPIRMGAVVEIKRGASVIKCKVLGLSKSSRAWEPNFVFEGMRLMKDPLGTKEKWKGHRFTNEASSVTKLISEGTGQRLLVGPYLTAAEETALFKDQFSRDSDD